MVLKADVSDASMLFEVASLRRDAQIVCVDEAASVGVYGLVVGVDVEQHRCQYTSLWWSISLSSLTTLLPVQHHEEASVFQHGACQVGQVYVASHL